MQKNNKAESLPVTDNTKIFPKDRIFWIGLLILAVVFVIVNIFIYQTVNYHLNSDDASELMLAEILAKEGKAITKSWYYSTEIRLLNTQLVYAPLFLLTHNWHLIRFLGTAILQLILLFSLYCLCKRARCVRFFPFAGLMLLLPFSNGYYYFVTGVPYYIPHIAISFFTTALCFMFISARYRKPHAAIILISSFILSVLSGLGGPRQILVCFLPLFLCAFLIWFTPLLNDARWASKQRGRDISILLFASVCLIGGMIGYWLNKHLLAKYYHFHIYEINYASFSFERLFNSLIGIMNTLGYRSGPFNLQNTMSNATCIFYLMALLYCIITGIYNDKATFEYRVLSLYTLCAIVSYTFLYAMTNMSYADRYNLPVIVFTAPLMATGLENMSQSSMLRINKSGVGQLSSRKGAVLIVKWMSTILAVIWLLLTALSSYNIFKNWSNESKGPIERNQIVDLLSDLGYDNGYATFWNANVFTELSNGKLRMHDWLDGGGGNIKNLIDINSTYKWLQPVSNDTEIPDGKVFLLFNNQDYDNFIWKGNLRERNKIVSTENYIVFGYNDYYEMLKSVYKDYSFTFDESRWLGGEGGTDINGIRTLFPGGISYGPYIPLYKGKHRITVRGENLMNGEYSCTYDSGKSQFGCKVVKKTNREVIYDVYCSFAVSNAETVIKNLSDTEMQITEINIHWV